MAQFTTDEHGNPESNAYVPCHRCGEPTPVTILAGAPGEIASNPLINVWCVGCAVAAEAEAATLAAAQEEQR